MSEGCEDDATPDGRLQPAVDVVAALLDGAVDVLRNAIAGGVEGT